jgi:hypothetical protein
VAPALVFVYEVSKKTPWPQIAISQGAKSHTTGTTVEEGNTIVPVSIFTKVLNGTVGVVAGRRAGPVVRAEPTLRPGRRLRWSYWRSPWFTP